MACCAVVLASTVTRIKNKLVGGCITMSVAVVVATVVYVVRNLTDLCVFGVFVSLFVCLFVCLLIVIGLGRRKNLSSRCACLVCSTLPPFHLLYLYSCLRAE
jgi:hypothetical protein